ncbi:hypothetical protein D4T97_002370 [Siminovitchia acidinfaciens]|uniref:Uncharacterized protein n=1 Tax=Siminovitchia acidinfaciens TaxID=2321395 RepID=A0A429Y7H5_9BACI|nr:DUF5392 family protein [Siminovitchia acidinfaciens]RST77352.1 hypothetical protein D4T97_002370 [Siminovitchia acidinfaciens]
MFPMANLPPFIQRELENLSELIQPLLKKSSRYGFWALPLILISVFNLVTILFFIPDRQNMVLTIILYAVLGALGMALSREAKHHRKEIHKISADYVISRIEKSDIAPASLKRKYTSLVKETPGLAINHFVKFLEAENRENSIKG